MISGKLPFGDPPNFQDLIFKLPFFVPEKVCAILYAILKTDPGCRWDCKHTLVKVMELAGP